MASTDEILTRLDNIEKMIESQSNTNSIPDYYIGGWVLGTVGFFFVIAIIMTILRKKELKTDNSLQYVKKFELLSHGVMLSLLATGIFAIYALLIFLHMGWETKFFTLYVLVATTLIGIGISMSTYVSSRVDGRITNEKLKDFIRSMSIDDVSKLKNIIKKISQVSQILRTSQVTLKKS